jgi:hypothetical protein
MRKTEVSTDIQKRVLSLPQPLDFFRLGRRSFLTPPSLKASPSPMLCRNSRLESSPTFSFLSTPPCSIGSPFLKDLMATFFAPLPRTCSPACSRRTSFCLRRGSMIETCTSSLLATSPSLAVQAWYSDILYFVDVSRLKTVSSRLASQLAKANSFLAESASRPPALSPDRSSFVSQAALFRTSRSSTPTYSKLSAKLLVSVRCVEPTPRRRQRHHWRERKLSRLHQRH